MQIAALSPSSIAPDRVDIKLAYNMPQLILKNNLPLLLLCLLLTCLCQQPAPVPTSFALITVTHTRAGDNSQFMKYLNRYALMDCPIVTEINIVWNNEQTAEELKVFQNKDQWKRPVYFYQTPQNSMNWRYKIPKESQAQVFFSIDDDITVGCQELRKGFAVWQQNAIGIVSPIISYGPRYYEYTVNKGFQYGRAHYKTMFNIGLVGLAFLSRHFLQLYYSDAFEIKEMRDYVVSKNNCDDIGLNWVVQYFYPELMTITIDGDIQNISPKVAQTTTASHYPFRSQCIQKFTEIFGVNALRYRPVKDTYPGKEKRLSPLKTEIVTAKLQYLQNYLTNPQGQNNASITIEATQKAQPQPPSTPNKVEQSAAEKQELLQMKTQIQQLLSKVQDYKLRQQETKQEKQKMGTLRETVKESLQLSEQLRLELYYRSYIQLALGMTILFLIWKLYECSKQRRKAKSIKLQSNEVQPQ